MACGLVIDDGDEGYTTSPSIQPIAVPSSINLPPVSIGQNPSANKWKDLHVPKQILSKLIENGIKSPGELIDLFETEQQLQQLCYESDPNLAIIEQRRFITSVLRYKQSSKAKPKLDQKQSNISPLPKLSLTQSDSSQISGSVIITEDESEGLQKLSTWTNTIKMLKQEISTEESQISTDNKQLKDQFEEQLNILRACIYSKLEQDLSMKLSITKSKSDQLNEMQNEITQCRREIGNNMHSIFNIQDRKCTNLKLIENTSNTCDLMQSSLKSDENDASSSNKIKEEIGTIIQVLLFLSNRRNDRAYNHNLHNIDTDCIARW